MTTTPYIPPDDNTATQHDGYEHLAVNNTRLRRVLTLLALKTTARFYRREGPCIPISRHLIVKTGMHVHLTEAATLSFVAAETSIPVPHVHCAFVRKNQAYIVMDRVQGVTIPEAFVKASKEDRDNITLQLQRMLRELRSVQPRHGMGIESCVGGTLRDSRISRSNPRFGPFKTTHDFHLWLRHGHAFDEKPYMMEDQDWTDLQELVAKQNKPWPPPVFTHADLNPFNIMVRGDKVVGIIDWELSGWYPRYWEYGAARFGIEGRTWWQESIDKFIDIHPDEINMEIIRRRLWMET